MDIYNKISTLKDIILNRLKELSPAPTVSEDEKEDKKRYGEKELSNKLHELLKTNEILNHAGIIEKVYGNKDASHRSLFRKKLNRDKTSEKSEKRYAFTHEEIGKIRSTLIELADEILKALSTTLEREKEQEKSEEIS